MTGWFSAVLRMAGAPSGCTLNRMAAPQTFQLMRAATYAAVGCALLLVSVKSVAYFATNSVALLSSLADSALDLVASAVNFFAVRHSLVPADHEHRFGHGKAEPLSALAQSAFVAGSAVLVGVEAATRFKDPAPVDNGVLGIGVMVFSIAATLMLIAFQRSVVKRTGSVAIDADALHYTGDLLLNGSVIVAMVLTTYLGWLWADAAFALAIAVSLFVTSLRIGMKAVSMLMDRELPDDIRDRILAIARNQPQVKGVHDLRTRASGVQKFMQMHIDLDGALNLTEAHSISDAVETALRQEFPGADIIIHQDPAGLDEPKNP